MVSSTFDTHFILYVVYSDMSLGSKRHLNTLNHVLRNKSLDLREEGDKTWEATFLAKETWRNLRITCRGFFEYCRNVISYAKKNAGKMPPFKGCLLLILTQVYLRPGLHSFD